MLLALVVLTRVLANPISNVLQKLLTRRGVDSLFVIFATHALLAVACLPVVVRTPSLPAAFWVDMAVVAGLTVAGNALLVAAVRRTDLSVLGPVNAYKSVVSLIPAAALLGEWPGAAGVAGIGLIVAGSYFVVDKRVSEPRRNVFVRFFTERGVQFRLAAMALAAVEAVFLKRALIASTAALTFAWWAVLGFVAAATVVPVVLRGRVREQARLAAGGWRTCLALAASTGLMQLCTIVAFGGFQVGSALALFQTSALVSVFLGWRVFNEQNILERLTGSAIMIAGAILIVLGR